MLLKLYCSSILPRVRFLSYTVPPKLHHQLHLLSAFMHHVSNARHLDMPQMFQDCSYLRGFGLAIPSAQKTGLCSFIASCLIVCCTQIFLPWRGFSWPTYLKLKSLLPSCLHCLFRCCILCSFFIDLISIWDYIIYDVPLLCPQT